MPCFQLQRKIGVLHENVIDKIAKKFKVNRQKCEGKKLAVKQTPPRPLLAIACEVREESFHIADKVPPLFYSVQSTSYVLFFASFLLHYNPMQTLFARYTHLQ